MAPAKPSVGWDMQDLIDKIDVEAMVNRWVVFLPDLGQALLVLLAFWAAYRLIRRPLRAALGRTSMAPALVKLLVDNIFKYTVMLLAVVMAASQLGFNVATALAGLGVVGIAVGFAAQDSLSNVISGFLIFWDKPFVVGDWITVEDEYGKVSEITLRSTRIRTPRNTFVVIPNKNIIDTVLINHSKHGALRVEAAVGIAYKESIPEAREVLLAAVADVPNQDPSHPPDVVVEELGGSSVNLLVRVWIRSADDERRTFFQLVERSKLALDAAGIQIPFPHLQLFVDDVEERVWEGAAKLPGAAKRLAAGEQG